MGAPGQQYRGMNYPMSYPPSSGSIEPQQAGHFSGQGSSGPGPVTSLSGDTAGMQSAVVGRAGSTTSEDQSLSNRSAQTSDNVGLNAQQNVTADGSKDSNVPAFAERNHLRSAGPPGIDENFSRQNSGMMDSRPVNPMGIDGSNLRYGQPGMDVRGIPQKQMFGQIPSRSAPFMNMNGVAIRPGQLPFGPDGAQVQVRGVEGMGIGAGSQSNEMDSMPSRPDQPLVGQDALQRRPGQSLPADSMFGRQGPPPFGMDGPGSRLGPPSAMDPMMRRAGHPMPDDGTMNRPGQNTNVDTRASMHGMPVRSDESLEENFRQGPQMGPGNVPLRPGMENMPSRPLPPMGGGMAEGMNIRTMQPGHPPPPGGMDVMQGRPGPVRMDVVERRGAVPEGIGPHSQHPGYGHQYPGYGSHGPASGRPGHGPPPGGFPTPDSGASGDQMFRNHMPPHAIHGDGRGPVAPSGGGGGDGYRPGAEFPADQRQFMSNGDVDMMRRAGEPPYAPKNFENGTYGNVTLQIQSRVIVN